MNIGDQIRTRKRNGIHIILENLSNWVITNFEADVLAAKEDVKRERQVQQEQEQ